MRRQVWTVVGVVVLAGGGSAPAQQGGEIDALVERLGHPSSETRQEATLRLAQRGEQARPALEQASRSLDVEVALRAQQLLHLLRVERIWLPTLCGPLEVSQTAGAENTGSAGPHDGDATTALASTLLEQIAEQTGNRLLLGDSFGSFHDMPVPLPCWGGASGAPTNRLPFWSAVDAICRQSGNHIRPGYRKQDLGLVVVAGDEGTCPVAYAGPMRGTITSVRRAYVEESEFQSGHVQVTHTFQVSVQLLWEDRLHLVSYQSRPELIEARSDRGDELTLSQPSRSGWSVVTPSRRQLTYQLRLEPPSWDARNLDVLRVRFGFVAVGDPRVAVLEDLASADPRYFEGMSVVVEKVEAKGPGWEITVHVTPESALPDPPEALYYENRFEAIDAQGQTMKLRETSPRLSEEGARFDLLFAASSPQQPPAQLKITYPAIRSQRDVELVWYNVPLPASRGE
jgi:hypothetical protein